MTVTTPSTPDARPADDRPVEFWPTSAIRAALDKAGYPAQRVRAETGLGAFAASDH